jgi:hypothetical protein
MWLAGLEAQQSKSMPPVNIQHLGKAVSLHHSMVEGTARPALVCSGLFLFFWLEDDDGLRAFSLGSSTNSETSWACKKAVWKDADVRWWDKGALE